MSFFDFFNDVVDTVSDTADKVAKGAKVVGYIAKKGNLLDVAEFAKSVGKWASPLKIAPTPVLEGGQKVIKGMRWTTGEGDPVLGTAFVEGSKAFRELEPRFGAARPDDTWSGGPAPGRYERRVEGQLDHVAILRDADANVGHVMSREADELNEVRRILDGLHNELADFGEYSKWIGFGQIGKTLQFSIETAAVIQVVNEARKKLWEMHDFANANAAAVREAVQLYEKVSREATPQDSIGDFDPPR